MHRFQRALSRIADDLVAFIGILCVAFGLAQLPAPWGAVAGPIAIGVGLIAAVRSSGR